MEAMDANCEAGSACLTGKKIADRTFAEAALELSRQGDTRRALTMLQQGIDRSRHDGDKHGEIAALNSAALVHSMRGDFWLSLAASIDAFLLAKAHRDRLGAAHAMTMLAGSLLLMTPLDTEIGLLKRALSIAEEARDIRLQIRVQNLLGIMLGDSGHFARAEMHFDTALILSTAERADFDRWRVLCNQANLQRKRAQHAHATGATSVCAEYCAIGLALIARVEANCQEHCKWVLLVDALRIAAMMFELQGLPERAADALGNAWALAKQQRLRSALPALGLEIARLELQAGRLNAAEATLAVALQEAVQFRPSPKSAELCEMMAAVRDMHGDARSAAHWRDECHTARRAFDAVKRDVRAQIARVAESVEAGEIG